MQATSKLTIKEFAQQYKVSIRTVHRLIKKKRIKAIDLNNGKSARAMWRIPEQEFVFNQ